LTSWFTVYKKSKQYCQSTIKKGDIVIEREKKFNECRVERSQCKIMIKSMYSWWRNHAIQPTVTTRMQRKIGTIEKDVSRLCCCLAQFRVNRRNHFSLRSASQPGIYRLPFARSSISNYGELLRRSRHEISFNRCF